MYTAILIFAIFDTQLTSSCFLQETYFGLPGIMYDRLPGTFFEWRMIAFVFTGRHWVTSASDPYKIRCTCSGMVKISIHLPEDSSQFRLGLLFATTHQCL